MTAGVLAPQVYTDEWDGYIVTFTGETIQPLDPDPAAIHLPDIAHALSNLCRFTGHTSGFYSVSQHSVLAAELAAGDTRTAPFALTALLHDASEAYLSDFSRPVKAQAGFGDVYKAAETRLMEAIAQRFGLVWPFPDAIHHIDRVLLRTEQRDLMPPVLRVAGDEMLPGVIRPWAPETAKEIFLTTYKQLTERET